MTYLGDKRQQSKMGLKILVVRVSFWHLGAYFRVFRTPFLTLLFKASRSVVL